MFYGLQLFLEMDYYYWDYYFDYYFQNGVSEPTYSDVLQLSIRS